jgi:RNA polymerase primary sigma factor
MSNASTRSSTRKGSQADENPIALYLKEINKVSLLTRSEEEKLAREAANGSVEAKERLAHANLRFVVNIAKKYQGRGLPLEDLSSVGLLRWSNSAWTRFSS